MTEGRQCMDHSGIVADINNLKDDANGLMKSCTAAHKRIDGMKNWVIAGMTSLVIQLVLAIVGFVVLLVKIKPSAN